jgi:hypothetical protein
MGSGDNPSMTDVAPATHQPLCALAISRRRIAANFLTIAGTNILGLIVTIPISVYVRRAMGPAAVGQISWAMAAVAGRSAATSSNCSRVRPSRRRDTISNGSASPWVSPSSTTAWSSR